MSRWITERSRYFWLSLTIGVLSAAVALPSFTDPWAANAGGFVFLVVVVAALVRGAVALGQAFLEGWRQPPGHAAR
jgi:protein-S-isoprenylcysteine O-methyltransferase Ste14